MLYAGVERWWEDRDTSILAVFRYNNLLTRIDIEHDSGDMCTRPMTAYSL